MSACSQRTVWWSGSPQLTISMPTSYNIDHVLFENLSHDWSLQCHNVCRLKLSVLLDHCSYLSGTLLAAGRVIIIQVLCDQLYEDEHIVWTLARGSLISIFGLFQYLHQAFFHFTVLEKRTRETTFNQEAGKRPQVLQGTSRTGNLSPEQRTLL